MKNPPSTYRCPCGATLSLIGGKYKIVILWFLYQNSVLRFNELHRLVLEADKLVERKVYPVVPPKVEYSLTPFGRSVLPVLEAMNAWGASYLEAHGA